jgi:hypothetical protein
MPLQKLVFVQIVIKKTAILPKHPKISHTQIISQTLTKMSDFFVFQGVFVDIFWILR